MQINYDFKCPKMWMGFKINLAHKWYIVHFANGNSIKS